MTKLHPLDASGLEAARMREAAFNEDVLPADHKPVAPREFYGDAMLKGRGTRALADATCADESRAPRTPARALPRMQEQGPWVGDHHVAMRLPAADFETPAGARVVMLGDLVHGDRRDV
jgi:hypothetical protein